MRRFSLASRRRSAPWRVTPPRCCAPRGGRRRCPRPRPAGRRSARRAAGGARVPSRARAGRTTGGRRWIDDGSPCATPTWRKPAARNASPRPVGSPSSAHGGGGGWGSVGITRARVAPISCGMPKAASSQLAMPPRPPGRSTRRISASPAAGDGKKISPKADVTRSKLPSSKPRFWPSRSSAYTSSLSSVARRRSSSSMPEAKSVATTAAPRRAASSATTPVPAATSSRRVPLGPEASPSRSSVGPANGRVSGSTDSAYPAAAAVHVAASWRVDVGYPDMAAVSSRPPAGCNGLGTGDHTPLPN